MEARIDQYLTFNGSSKVKNSSKVMKLASKANSSKVDFVQSEGRLKRGIAVLQKLAKLASRAVLGGFWPFWGRWRGRTGSARARLFLVRSS